MEKTKIISWNVNGIRAIIKKDFLKDIEEIDPDIICLQETKASELDALKALEVMDGYHINVNSSKERKGYSGTAILSKELPINISNDIGIDLHDKEGRVMLFENKNFFLVNVYVPNSGQELRRLDYRNKWDYDFLNYCKKLSQKNQQLLQVILMLLTKKLILLDQNLIITNPLVIPRLKLMASKTL